MIDSNNPEINVDELMAKIRAEVAQRHGQPQAIGASANAETSRMMVTISHIDALIRNAESRAIVRTKWPDKFNRFPLNLSSGFQKLALKILNFIFKDQREVNLNLISSLKESIALNRQLVDEVARLKAQLDTRLNAVDTRNQGLEERLDKVDNQLHIVDNQWRTVNNRLTEQDECIDDIDTRVHELDDSFSTIDTWINGWMTEVDGQFSTVNTNIQKLDTHLVNLDEGYRKNDSYLKNDLMQQKRLVTLFLEEARQRLPEPFNQQQLQTFVDEEQHTLDALYAAFEEEFRGSREEITQRFKVYLPLIAETKVGTPEKPILDIGCGRGEWLELLGESGYTARGLDINHVFLEQCRYKGLEVIESDVIAYLQTLPDASLGAVTGFHIIEHLPFEVLIKLLDETIRVLTPGGLAIFETPNPENLVVGACNFYSDPTHRNPLFPPTTEFLLENRGFIDVQLLRLSEYRIQDQLELSEEDTPITSKLNQLIQITKLNFYAAPDFAVCAKKA